jgi:HEPN domain-containing protein
MDCEPLTNVDNIVKHWTETSDDDFKVMLSLLESKQNSWALFLGHIVVEKLLKAYYVKVKCHHAPLTHDLQHLAKTSGIPATDEQLDWLSTITKFNLNARYDDYKRKFYTMCTAEYVAEWSEKIKQLRLWIKEML